MIKPIYTLLIIEDVAIDREQFRRLLLADASCTYRFLEAGSVAAGLELYRSSMSTTLNAGVPPTTIDAILLDYMLPDADGLEFLAVLCAKDSNTIPPIIMITGRGEERIAVAALKLGAVDYLVKSDLTRERLQSAIHSAIEHGRWRLQSQRSNDLLWQASDLLRISIDTMWDCFGIYSAIRDPAGQIIDFSFDYLNKAALENNQMTTADLSRGLCEVFPAIRTAGLFDQYCQVVETGKAFNKDDLTYTDLFGMQQLTKAYDMCVNKLNDGFVAVWRDVTVQRQAEEERDRFFNISLDLLAVGNFAGYLVRLNPAFEQVLGFTSAELMAQPYLDFVHPDDREHTRIGATELSVGKQVANFENRYRCQDGSYRWLSWSATPSVDRGLWYAVARDVTENKHIQAALEAHNRDLNSFVYVVSHDLKAPLRAVSNLSQWIEDDLEGVMSADIRSQMVLLRSRVERMAATIDGLLDYARIGRIADSVEPVSVAELLAEIIDSLAPPPTFKIDISPSLPTFHTKRLLLSQVFANLISNGIKHHHRADGSIYISTQDRHDLYEFIVADNGPGIAPQHYDQIFTVFQAINPQNRSDSSGIGLSIVKKIIEAEGGTIWLESQLGKGTEFYFTWPKKPEIRQLVYE
jgi:PAS domain S-box-containing protein